MVWQKVMQWAMQWVRTWATTCMLHSVRDTPSAPWACRSMMPRGNGSSTDLGHHVHTTVSGNPWVQRLAMPLAMLLAKLWVQQRVPRWAQQ